MLHTNSSLTIAIIDDHPIVIEGLQKILIRDLPIQEIQEYHLGGDFITYLKNTDKKIDLVLLDITLPDISGVELCREIKNISTETYVLGFSNHNDRSLVMQMLAHGASGYVVKNASASELITCITEALNGQITFSEEIQKIIAKPSASQLKSIPPLTKREKQILQMISDGKTSPEMADELQLSLFTIETHRRNLMQKFEAKNTALLIKAAIQLHLI
ncbi:response regulator transcription factor [Cytophagaceae bacterium DM2B3-1]|uniref:Response regulator transcription factor n=1 Tax=Xanthocytophaga flava TaxID=3048013 RepID=A0ABT7CQU0_9BACT|nr:response regulator transcription factor [Xanthocytophaga flavus]MDJ1496092.1 response regulator transcription factor [Xanthocytophaga flavus]